MTRYYNRNRNLIYANVQQSGGVFGEVELINQYSGLYPFTSFTFTSAGISGQNGPTLANCTSSYNTATYPWLTNTSYFNVVTQGIQQWTVPANGVYEFTLRGADGGGTTNSTYYPQFPGQGATIKFRTSLTAGTVLNIVVGQTVGTGLTSARNGTSGGGGTWVYTGSIGGAGLIGVAGGGGGWGHGSSANTGGLGMGGNSTTDSNRNTIGYSVIGYDGVYKIGNGTGNTNGIGYGGGGASSGSFGGSGGGAGWLSVGSNSVAGAGTDGQGGQQWVGGNGDGTTSGPGGFGGGGGSYGNGNAGGGGGGYTGGPAGNNWSGSYWGNGGGGGSYYTGTLVSATAGQNGMNPALVANGSAIVTRVS